MGTVIDDKQRSNVERHQRWDRIQRADLLAQYHSLQVGFPISTEKFYTVDDRSSHATKSNRTVIVWHLASSQH